MLLDKSTLMQPTCGTFLFAGVHCSLAGDPKARNVAENQLALVFCEKQSSVVDSERTVVLTAEAIVTGKSGEDVTQEFLCGSLSVFNNSEDSLLSRMEVCCCKHRHKLGVGDVPDTGKPDIGKEELVTSSLFLVFSSNKAALLQEKISCLVED